MHVKGMIQWCYRDLNPLSKFIHNFLFCFINIIWDNNDHVPTINYLKFSFRYRVEDWCAEGIFLMFQVKGINNFQRHFPTDISFARKELTKTYENLILVGVLPFDCSISSKIFCSKPSSLAVGSPKTNLVFPHRPKLMLFLTYLSLTLSQGGLQPPSACLTRFLNDRAMSIIFKKNPH